MKIQAKSSRRTIPPHPDVVRLVQDLQNIPKNELAAFIQAISQWSWPRSELHVWFGVLDRFDEIMESIIAQYDAANLQLNPFSKEDKALLFQILRFERMLLDNSTNRKLFNSYDRLSILVMSPDVDVAIEALSLILRPAHQYTLQMSLNVVLRVNHTHLEYLARSWPALREYSTTYLKLLSPQEDINLPSEASDVRFQWYSPKSPTTTDQGPHHVHLKALSNDERDVMTILQDAIDGRAINQHDRFDLMCRIRVAKSLAKDQLELRQKLVSLRLLAIAVYCHTHTDVTGQNARLLVEPDVVSSTAPLLAIDKGITEQVQAAAVHALDGICHHRGRSNEVLTAVNASVAHGLLMSLFRKTVARLDDSSSEPYAPLFEALQNFMDFLTTNEVSYNMIISAGLIEHLKKVVANRLPSRATMVSRTIPLLENALYGPPQVSTAGQRNNSPFSQFLNDSGIPFLLDRIKFEVESDIAEFKDQSNIDGPPLGYGKVPTPRINVLKHLLRTVQRMLQSTGSAEVLRLLPEPDSAFIPSLKSILDHRNLFGATILAAATLVIATWVHNEPSALTIIQESKLPDSFYKVIEQGIEPMIEVIHGILNAIGALSLNQAGQTLLQTRTEVFHTIFGIFTSELHMSPLQEKSNASLIGGDVDELVRHHPWLKDSMFKGITDVLEKIESMAKDTKPKDGLEGYFNLIAADNKVEEVADTSGTPMETDTPTPEILSSSIEKPTGSSQPSFEIGEMPVYQFLNSFSKFLVGFFSHAQHCREILSDTDILARFDRILTLPCWPIEFPMARNLEAILMVNRRLMDASPASVLRHRVDSVKGLMDDNEDFRKSKGSDNKIVQYVNVTQADLEEAQVKFTSMRKLLLHLILLNDVYSQSSHSIHQPFRRETINMLEPLIENPTFVPQIGELFKASAWEILHLRAQTPESTEAKSGDAAPTTSGSAPGPSTQPANPAIPSVEHPFAAFIPRKRLLAPDDAKGRTLSPEERNQMNVKSVLHAFSNVLQSLFSGISKALPISRRMASADTVKFKKDSKIATKILADTLVDGLRSYDASDDSVVVMGFCALAISSTSCIGPESRHGQNMQTGLFLEFERSGGIDAVVNVCTFCADLIDQYSAIKDDVKTTRDREIMGIAHYFLRHPLIWFYHLASGKPLVESPQTTEILRYKTYEDFDPAETIVRLRLALLPIFKRFWEARWLPDTSESVRKAIIFGLLAILKGEYEDSGRHAGTSLAIPGHVPIMRRPPPPPSPAMIQQLTDMGFPEAAARTALMRARGDLNAATEYLLANAHLFDGDDNAAVDQQDAAAEPSNDNTPSTSAVVAEPTEEPIQPPAAATTEGQEPEPTPKRDYAKELAQAREELKETIVPNALRLADANPAFIDDIRDVFIGPAMNSNAKVLFGDIKKFSDGASEVSEIPLQVRCRILALAYLKVGMKGLGLSKEDANELLQSLLALLLAGPVPGTPSEPKLPKWLASHMLLSDRILCSSEDINPVSILKEEETSPAGELYVGPSFTESRKVLFDFCMRLARIPDLPKDDLLSLFGVLSFLTKDYALASEFVRQNGLSLVLQYFKNKRQPEDVAAVSMGIFRHTMEDPITVEAYMRQDLKRWGSGPRSRAGESVNSYLRSMPHAALRDPQVFIRVTTDMCVLNEAQPSIGGSYRIRLKDEVLNPPTEGKTESSENLSRQFDDSALETATAVIHQLTGEFMLQYKQTADQPIATPANQLANTVPSAEDSGTNTPSLSEPRPQLPSLPDLSSSNSKEMEYGRFVHNLVSELLLSYDACKVAFLTYPRKKPLTNVVKEIAKFKSIPMTFLLQEITMVKGDPTDWPKKSTKPNHFHSMIVALCADINGPSDLNAVNSPITSVRKCVLESILKALKEPVQPNASETTEQRYARYIALGDLCNRLLTYNPQIQNQGQKPPEESLLQLAKIMLDKNFVPTFSAILSEVDLAHPMSGALTSSILAPLEALTRASVRIGRVSDQPGGIVITGNDRPIEYLSESEGESVLTDGEEVQDPYSTSALGMYGGETEGAFVDVEEPLGEDEEEDVEMDYVEEEYDSEESHDSEEAEAMEVAAADDVDIHDGEETDPEDDEEMLGGENEEDEEEEISDDEDEESVSDNQDGAQGNMGEDMWQELDLPRDESGMLLEGDDDDDDDDEGVDVLDPGMEDALEDLAYALDGGDVGEAPVFVPPPRPIGEELDTIDDGRGFLVENHGQGGLPPMEIALPFDSLPEDFGRIGHRRAFRTPHIIRTSMLQEMLGAPTAQMIQDMARSQNGDIHLALSGHAAQLLFQEGLETGHRMMSRYITTRPGRSPSGREMGLSSSMSTGRRWSEEARVNAGPSLDERLSELVNHVINTLLPAAREVAKAEEIARLQKEAEEKAKAEQEAQEKEEAEEKARKEAEAQAELELQKAEEQTVPVTDEEQLTTTETPAEPSNTTQGQDMETSPVEASNAEAPAVSNAEPSTSNNDRPRVTVMYRGESIDITDADIDPEFLNAVPEDIRDEILGNFVREQQRQTRPARVPEAEMDMDFLNALPPDIREDVLRGQAIAQITGAVDMDAASVLATLPEELRQTVLLEQDDAMLEAMPSALLAEANALRAQHMARRAIPITTSSSIPLPPQQMLRKAQHREIAQLLDKGGLANLVRLLFFIDQNRRNSLQQVLVNLSENNKSRIDLLNLLLVLLSGNKTDLSSIDRSFAQLSVRSTKPSAKGKQKEESTVIGAPGERIPEEHVVLQRTLDTLTAIVHANESASVFFLTEQEVPAGLHRASSKKGKGKERPGTGIYYPFVQLLSLLERPNLMHQAHSLDAISGLLSTVTKPLTVLREPPKPQEGAAPEVEVPVPPAPAPAVEETSTQPISSADAPAAEPVAANPEVSSTQPTDSAAAPVAAPASEEVPKASETTPAKEDPIRDKPPHFPDQSLKLVVNLLTMGECSSRCFQNTQALVFHLSSLPHVRDVIISELKTKAEELGRTIYNELDTLLRSVNTAKKGEELPSSITTKFSLPTSNQARLLRILKILENIYMPTLPGRASSAAESPSTDDQAQAIFENLPFALLWKKLSDCLKSVEDRSDATHVATFLLPLMESLMVVCKSTTSQSQAAINKALRASASPRSPTVDREGSGDIFVTFTDKHRKVLNLMVRNKPSLMNGSFSLLVHNPRVLDFDNKRNYFVHKLRHKSRLERERDTYPTIPINVRRAKVFEDSFQSIMRLKDKDLKYGKLNVRFSGEEGVDAGGVTREWFRILAREIFNPNYALFAPCGADRLTYQPNPASGINPDHLRYFKFVGRILGKAIYDQRLLDGHFARSVYRQLLGKAVDYRDLEWSDPGYYNGLRWMLDNSVEAMDLTFSEQSEQLGEMVIVDLKPNGRNIAVTDSNKDEYIQLIAEYRLTTSIKQQLDFFLEGFYEIIPKEHIAIFDEKELELLISGTPDIDVEDWRSATEYHGYTASDAGIVWWWRALKSFSRSDRAKVLSFATGTAKVPLGGFAELQGVDGIQRFSIHKDYGPLDRLPQAHTCFNQIDLPQYSSYEKLRQQLLLAINEGGEGFGFA